jgi:hypothetical protein
MTQGPAQRVFAEGSLAKSNGARIPGRRNECEPLPRNNDRAKSGPIQRMCAIG